MEPIKLRASSLPDLCDCPARWEAKYIRKLPRLPRSTAAQLGTAVHAGTAVFDKAHLSGSDITVDDAAGVVVDSIYRPEEEVDWGEDKLTDVEKIALALHGMYCLQIAPRQTYVAVEATCQSLEISDLGLALTGTTDRITEDCFGNLGIADIKTSKSAVAADGTVKTAGHAAQIAVYELLAEASTGRSMTAPAQIIGLQVAKTDRGRRAGIGTITGAREMLVGTEEAPGLLQIISGMLHAGTFYGNPKSQACGAKYCPAYHQCRWRR